MKAFTIILLSIILFSCYEKADTRSNSVTTDKAPLEKEDDKLRKGNDTATLDISERFLPVPRFKEFKHFCETFGGSYLQKTYLYRPQEKGHFGAHHLYDRQKHVQMGFLIAHNTVEEFSNWKFSDTTQVFVALVMKRAGSRLKLFDKIGISDKKEVLIEFFGKPKIENDTMIVYWDKNRTIGQFEIQKGIINSFIYGRYNDNINLPLTQYELNKINVW